MRNLRRVDRRVTPYAPALSWPGTGRIMEPMKPVRALLGLTAVGVGAAVAGAPPAGASGADTVITQLEADGYIVNINWVNGYNTTPLSSCTVVQVNNPDRSGGPMEIGDAVYVDVRCPNSIEDEGGTGDFGIGIFIGG